MQNKTILAISVVVILIVGALALVFVLDGKKKTNIVNETPSNSSQEKVEATPQGNTREVMVEGNEYSFTPSSIDVKRGERIRLTFKNNGKAPHDLVITALNLSTKKIGFGQTDTIEFNVESDKNLEFYCSIGNHKDLGMTGQLNVK